MVYFCERKGLPKVADQRAALLAAGLTADEMAEPWHDRATRKPRPGEAPQPERDHMIGAAREGDEVWVARLAVLGTAEADVLAWVARLTAHGAVLCDASTGQRHRCPPGCEEVVAERLRLVAAWRSDERKAVLEKARRGLRGRPAGKPKVSAERMEAARGAWFDATIDGDEAAKRAGIGRRTLHRHFGPRETPAFGKPRGRKPRA